MTAPIYSSSHNLIVVDLVKNSNQIKVGLYKECVTAVSLMIGPIVINVSNALIWYFDLNL